MDEMLRLAAINGIAPMIELMPIHKVGAAHGVRLVFQIVRCPWSLLHVTHTTSQPLISTTLTGEIPGPNLMRTAPGG